MCFPVFILNLRLCTVQRDLQACILFFCQVGTGLGSLLRKMSKDAQEQISLAMSIADEAIGNIRTVRAFAMEPKEIG